MNSTTHHLVTILLVLSSFSFLHGQDILTANVQPSMHHSDHHPHDCGMKHLQDELFMQHPALRNLQQQIDEKARRDVYIERNENQRMGVVYTIPVVVHVVHYNGTSVGTNENISDAQIIQGIVDLNNAYRNIGFYDPNTGSDVEIEFCLAAQDPSGNFTTGITRTASNSLTDLDSDTEDGLLKTTATQWDPFSYCNIWLVDEICSSSAGNCGTAGYAYLASAHGQSYDGIVNEARWFGSSQNNSKVHIHEMGHYLNLNHTFDGCTNNDCTTDGDKVCDTPPENSTTSIPCGSLFNSCNTDEDDTSVNNPFRSISLGGLGAQNDMYENYMDYGFQTCQDRFTAGQTARMRSAITGIRSSLLSSAGCVNPSTPAVYFTQPSITITEEFDLDLGTCIRYKDIQISMSIAAAPSGDAQISIQYAGSASGNGIDYANGTAPEITFPSGSNSDQTFTLRIYDDWSIENTESIDLTYTISGTTNAVAGTVNQSMNITIADNDIIPAIAGKDVLLTDDLSSGAAGWTYINFGGSGVPLIWRVGSGGISGSSAYISNNSGASRGDDPFRVSRQAMVTPFIDATNANSDITLEFDLDVSGAAGDDFFELFYNYGTGWYIWQSGITNYYGSFSATLPASVLGTNFQVAFVWYNNGNGILNGLPASFDNVRVFTEGQPSAVETTTCTQNISFGPNQTVYVYNNFENNLVAKVQNLSSWDYGCTSFQIDRIGTSAQSFQDPNPANFVTDKTLSITPSFNNPSGQFEITLYFSNSEINGWESATGNSRNAISIVKSSDPISSGTGNAELAMNTTNGTYNVNDYYVTGIFNSGFSSFGGISSSASLPIELIDFNAMLSNNQVILQWMTSFEKDCKNYEVERSIDGFNFHSIGTLSAKNNGHTISRYTLVDQRPMEGHNYYRLKQYDYSEKMEIVGRVIHIHKDQNTVVSLFPNPADDMVQFTYPTDIVSTKPNITIYSIDGRNVNTPDVMKQSDGLYQFSTKQLQEGIYYVSIGSNQWTVGQIVKLHIIH